MSDATTREILSELSTPLPDDPRSLSRRRFLQALTATAGVAVVPPWMAEMAEAAAPIGPGDGVLVLVTMGGGNDGLNTVVPIADGTYYDRRGSLAIPPWETRHLTADRGLHPSLGYVEGLWRQGQVAIIEGVGSPTLDLSHFSSTARWMAGGPAGGGFHTGWLGRYIDGLPGGDDPFHAVSIGSAVPLVVQGRNRIAAGLPAESNGIFDADADPTHRRWYEALASYANASTGRGALADALTANGREAVDLATTLAPIYAEEGPAAELSRKLDLCARLINANVGIRVLAVTYGDFDSHANQPAMHNARMTELDAAMGAFHRRLDATFAARTVVLTVSEFGRRIRANHSNGTDHGAAGTLLAIGPQVRGGFYGQQPPLDRPDRLGNLAPTVDFRSVYATVLDTWLAADSREILGGHYENLGFLAAPAPNRTTSGLDPSIAGSTFRYRAEIVRLYKAFFARLPDSAGLEHWVQARRSGLDLARVADSFASSAEFAATYGHLSNEAFVDRLYHNVLGRAADSEGLAYWVGILGGGSSRGTIVVGFSESTEFVAASAADVDQVDRAGPVARLYLAYFERDADLDGLRYWIGSGLSHQAVSDAFAASDEFRARYGALSDEAFLDRVYANVLGRAPDGDGRAYWLGELARGISRGSIMLGFSESAEFIARTGTLS